ncbi:MAG TPA: hypothetical protein PLG50_03275 [bacterium]|nr:hypothetical protein [bacterium]HQG44666.1 hypothetical protein [bacterium]HQJ63374.1 hypothetical protein [bacterium]
MNSGKWLHGLVALTAAILILAQQSPVPKGMSRQAEMVPLSRIDVGPLAPISISEFLPPPTVRRAALQPRTPVSSSTASPILPTSPPMKAAKATAVVSSSAAGQKSEAGPEATPAIAADAPADAEKAIADARPSSLSANERPRAVRDDNRLNERIHRDVVLLIKNYIAGHASREVSAVEPMHLASADRLALPEPSLVAEQSTGDRWRAVLAAGPVRVFGAVPGMKTAGYSLDGFLDFRITSGIALGGSIGLDRMHSRDGRADFSLLQASVQARLFFHPRARLTPFAQAGIGYGQYLTGRAATTGDAAALGKKSAPVAHLGAGIECPLTRRAGAQLLVDYERLQKRAAGLKPESSGKASWSFMAGITLSLSGPRTITRPTANGLAVNAASQK